MRLGGGVTHQMVSEADFTLLIGNLFVPPDA
jgi:hypothetical protein